VDAALRVLVAVNLVLPVELAPLQIHHCSRNLNQRLGEKLDSSAREGYVAANVVVVEAGLDEEDAKLLHLRQTRSQSASR